MPQQESDHPAAGGTLDLNFLTYGTMLSRSKTSALGFSSGTVSAMTATGFRNGCNDNAQESLEVLIS